MKRFAGAQHQFIRAADLASDLEAFDDFREPVDVEAPHLVVDAGRLEVKVFTPFPRRRGFLSPRLRGAKTHPAAGLKGAGAACETSRGLGGVSGNVSAGRREREVAKLEFGQQRLIVAFYSWLHYVCHRLGGSRHIGVKLG